MSDQRENPEKSLSEISHLFLSSVRERQTQGGVRPKRVPPPRTVDPAHPHSVELTAEELAGVLPDTRGESVRGAPVSAVLASHLGSRQSERAREYAAHLGAQTGRRIGLIEIDAAEFRVTRFDTTAGDESAPGIVSAQPLDARLMREAVEELSWEIDQWIVLLPAPRASEARTLLRQIDHWVLLATCDHDGVVSAYRTLKGLADSHQTDSAGKPVRPRLSLALLDVHDHAEADHVCHKLASVCEQFLGWKVELEAPVDPQAPVHAHDVFIGGSTHDKAQLAAAPQWEVAANFIRKLDEAQAIQGPLPSSHGPEPDEPETVELSSAGQPVAAATAESRDDEVIDLPGSDASATAIVSAVLRGGGELVECPIHPPMCPEAAVAVSRQRRLVLVAVTNQGLGDLRAIGQAYRWLIENRPLLTMALPQFAIDAHQLPQLHLLVDHADVSAEMLQPILQSGNVSVHAYRKLRWGGKTGLLLEAA